METLNLGKKVKVQSEILGETREILVRLPESYHGSENRYPVLYMLDADYTPFLVNDLSTIDYLRFTQRVPELIIIGIYNTNRDRDMLPEIVPERDSGGADEFLSFIKNELAPIVNEEYRTTGYNMLHGASNAGVFGLYALFSEPSLFDIVIAPSPMIGWCTDLIRELSNEAFDDKEIRNKLYMIYGKEDYPHVTEPVSWFLKHLEAKAPDGFKWKCEYLEDEGHVPYQSLYRGLKWVFSK